MPDLGNRVRSAARKVLLPPQAAPSPEPFDGWRRRKIAELLRVCFPKQRQFIEDPHKGKAVLKTRRAGGSYALACYHCVNLLEGHNGAYIGPTAKQARRILWNGRAGLKAVARRCGLDTAAAPAWGLDFNNTETIATLRGNGATCMLGGAETRDDCEKYRGEALALVTIDEPASIKEHLEYLVDEVLEPTLLDEDGTICLVGTPGRNLTGKFYEVTTGQRSPADPEDDADEDVKLSDWSIHRWSMQDNPHLKHRETFLARVFRRHGWDPALPPPRALREYFGLWVREESTLVYKFSKARNVYAALPQRPDWEYGLSIDLGSDDATAFRVTMFSRNWPIAYGIELAKAKNLTPSDIAERIKGTRNLVKDGYRRDETRPEIQGYAERYKLLYIVVDTGGLGKMVVQELNDRHLLSPRAEPAEKTAKLDFIEHFNDDLLHGRYQVAADDAVIPEWETLQWSEDETKRVEDPRLRNDGADATLYGWRRAKHYWAVTEEAPPPEGSAEALNAQAREWERQAERELLNEKGKPWWEG